MTHSKILLGDVRTRLQDVTAASVRTCVTSPPYYGLRNYGNDQQIGLEASVGGYVDELVSVFREVRRVLTDDGTLWLNLGDTYSTGSGGGNGAEAKQHTSVGSLFARPSTYGIPQKNLLGVPWRVAFALQEDGWILRSDIIWAKPNPMPESVKDRPTRSHEYLFLLTKSERYFYNADAFAEEAVYQPGGSHADVKQGGFNDKGEIPGQGQRSFRAIGNTGFRNKRDVWFIPPEPFGGAHFAVMPTELVKPCILAGSEVGDVVLDPFAGSGTVGVVASRCDRSFVGVELNPVFATMAADRIYSDAPLFNTVEIA
jgi:DNA modification methylase